MKLRHPQADFFVPDQMAEDAAVARTTHLGVGAHQDDLEFMALHGILECFKSDSKWFGGVTCTDGAGSSRTGPYEEYSDEAMKAVRVAEQRAAATVGKYSFVAQLAHPSLVAKNANKITYLADDLEEVLRSAKPEVVYTHNPFDKHATHVGVLLALLQAIKRLPAEDRPRKLIGCEVWRSLDWLPEDLKLVQNLDLHPNLAAALNGVFDSQISGGKRYDLAVEGRRLANATFLDSHSADATSRASYAIDLSELIGHSSHSKLMEFQDQCLTRFRESLHLDRLTSA